MRKLAIIGVLFAGLALAGIRGPVQIVQPCATGTPPVGAVGIRAEQGQHLQVFLVPEDTRTLSGTGKALGWFSPTKTGLSSDGGSAWYPVADMNLTVNAAAGSPRHMWSNVPLSGFGGAAQGGRIYYEADSIAISGGTECTISLEVHGQPVMTEAN